jgi:pilus assembly protein Flp/PilA
MEKLLRNSKGQGMTEYIIIVALIAIAAIGVVTLFGNNIRRLFASSANALAGETEVKVDTKKGDRYKKTKNLADFAKENKGD